MIRTAEREARSPGKTRGCANHGLIHELSKRLEALARYDQYLAAAEGYPELQDFWRGLKAQDQEVIGRLVKMAGEAIQNGDL